MASFEASELTPRVLNAALVALCKRNFYGATDVKIDELAASLYAKETSGLDSVAAVAHLSAAEGVLKQAARENWDPAAVEEAVTRLNLSPPLAEAIGRFWRNERTKVHDALQKQATWNPHLKNLAWRIDVKTSSKDVTELNEPSAILELAAGGGHRDGSGKDGSTLRFELTRDQLGGVLDQFKDIEEALAAYK